VLLEDYFGGKLYSVKYTSRLMLTFISAFAMKTFIHQNSCGS